MKHKYYLADSLDELEQVHDELVRIGVTHEHIHVLSENENDVLRHHMLAVNSFYKTDIIRGTIKGAAIGFVFSSSILLMPLVFNFDTPIGMVPFVFAALVVLGFATWEGGLWGIQEPNSQFLDYLDQIHAGKHLMIIDYADEQFASIEDAENHHPNLQELDILSFN